ncbi:MAG: H/ACA ribonucleoprotein complex subunit GAR1 [Candidatus Syntropharchaeia archaeon]
MKRLGTVLHVSTYNNLIVRGGGPSPDPNISGVTVLNKRGKRIGKILDVFGPVEHPYISVKPIKGIKLHNLIGEEVFMGGGYERRKKGKGV